MFAGAFPPAVVVAVEVLDPDIRPVVAAVSRLTTRGSDYRVPSYTAGTRGH
jgi:hypothetical protein